MCKTWLNILKSSKPFVIQENFINKYYCKLEDLKLLFPSCLCNCDGNGFPILWPVNIDQKVSVKRSFHITAELLVIREKCIYTKLLGLVSSIR